MTAAPVAFRSNPGRYQFIGATELVNCYAEKMDQDAKAPLAVVPCEGLQFWGDADSSTGTLAGPCRGMIFLEEIGTLYSIHPSSAYRFDSDGSGDIRIGTVPGTDPVQLSRNQKDDPQIVVKSDAMLQVIESNSLSVITDPDLPSNDPTTPTPVVSADYVSGYHVYLLGDQRFYLSGINDAKNIDALDNDRFKQRSGVGKRVVENNGELVGFGSNGVEFWRNTGNADFPFDPIGFRSRGCRNGNAVTQCDNSIMFIGDDNNIYRMDNYNPVIISTPAISRLLDGDQFPADLRAFSFDRQGHKFACFTSFGDGSGTGAINDTGWTRCYDAATQTWHSRSSYGYTFWRAIYSASAFDKIILGDALSGDLFYLNRDTYTEFDVVNGDSTMIWKVISPPLHVFPNGAILDAVHFDFATGFGTMSGQGSNPKLMLRTSTDGGNTFENYRELELGTTGNYKARVTARRLGRFGPKGIVFELSVSDPVARALVGVDVELRPLKR